VARRDAACGEAVELAFEDLSAVDTREWSDRVLVVITLEAAAAAFAQWIVPDLPLYGNDHERGDLAP
jgi:hypothetical protein